MVKIVVPYRLENSPRRHLHTAVECISLDGEGDDAVGAALGLALDGVGVVGPGTRGSALTPLTCSTEHSHFTSPSQVFL
jgi:hypothetical protein